VTSRCGRAMLMNVARARSTECVAKHARTPGNTRIDKRGVPKCIPCHRRQAREYERRKRRKQRELENIAAGALAKDSCIQAPSSAATPTNPTPPTSSPPPRDPTPLCPGPDQTWALIMWRPNGQNTPTPEWSWHRSRRDALAKAPTDKLPFSVVDASHKAEHESVIDILSIGRGVLDIPYPSYGGRPKGSH
jgi:hypothetical protein